MDHMLLLVLFSGIFGAMNFLAGLQVAWAYRKFSNVPPEQLQSHKVGRWSKIRFYGMVCKSGPWVTRTLNLIQGIFVGWVFSLLLANYCRGDMSFTLNCVDWGPGCSYNKLKNCMYFYTYCNGKPVDTSKVKGCFTIEERNNFYGRIDMRLVDSDEQCKCELLE